MENNFLKAYKIITGTPIRTIWKAEYPIMENKSQIGYVLYTIPVNELMLFGGTLGIHKSKLCFDLQMQCDDKITGEVIYYSDYLI